MALTNEKKFTDKLPMPKVLCTSLSAEEGPHHDILRKAGFEPQVVARDVNIKQPENYIPLLQGCCAVVAGAEPFTEEILKAVPELRVISRTGVGYDAIDLEACDRLGVAVTITPGVNHHAVAEHAVALLMGVARGFPRYDMGVRSANWTRKPGPRVMGSTLGLVGLGRIGQAMATRGIGLGMKVIACDPFACPDFVAQHEIEMVELHDLYARADYISLHVPALPETEDMINADTIAEMKNSAVLINTSRGTLVNEDDLVQALSTGQLRAAGLDVYRTEPLPADSPLLSLDNVLLSPHIAGQDFESHADTFTMAAENIIALRDGRWPAESLVNLKDASDWCW